MAFTRESESKDGFFDHGANFFKNKAKASKSDDADTRRKLAKDSDPYSHVDPGTGGAGKRARDFSSDPNAAQVEDPTEIAAVHTVVRKGDPMAEVYRTLREHGGVGFGAQRADGTWETFPVDPLESTVDILPEREPSAWQETLSEETQAKLAEALKQFAPKP